MIKIRKFISRKTIFTILGFLLIILGILGLFLPLISGWLLIFLGLLLLGNKKFIKKFKRFKK